MSMTVGNKKLKSDINITPYIDILLVMLIIFMTVAPLKKYEHPVRVPQPSKILQPKDVKPDSIIVDMELDHSIRLNEQPITLGNLESTLTQIFRRRAARNMFVRGDARLPYGDMFVILDIAKRSGAIDIALLQKKPENASSNFAQAAP